MTIFDSKMTNLNTTNRIKRSIDYKITQILGFEAPIGRFQETRAIEGSDKPLTRYKLLLYMNNIYV